MLRLTFKPVLGTADFLIFSTDFRQFEQYLNVPGLDVCCTCVSLSHLPDVRVWTRWPLLGIVIYITHARYDSLRDNGISILRIF